MKNQMIFKVLMFSFSIFAFLGGVVLFIISPELALGYKILVLCCGISILGISFGIFALIEAISALFEKMDMDSSLTRENLTASKEAVEILEALNVIEIKKNKTVKDIYELISTGKVSNKETGTILDKADNPVKVEINSEKLELLLEDIKTLLSSRTVEKEVVSERNKEELLEEEIKFELKEEADEENIVTEIFKEEALNIIEENNFNEQINDSFDEQAIDTAVEEEKIETESVEVKEEILTADLEEDKNKILYDLESDIEIEEKEQSFTQPFEDEINPINKTTEIMSAGDYFNGPQLDESKIQKRIDETNFLNAAEPKEEMVYGLVAEEQSVKKNENKIQFADTVIEDLIRDILEKPSEEILESDLEGIDVLLAGNQGVKRLEGVEKLENLQKLDLWKAEISDIEILKGLKKLVYLRLSKTMVKDITPLKELENLEELYLQEVPIQTLKPLSSLQRLKYLYLEKTKIDSLEPLLEISTLEELYLWGAIIDLTPGGVNSEVLKTLESRGCSIIK